VRENPTSGSTTGLRESGHVRTEAQAKAAGNIYSSSPKAAAPRFYPTISQIFSRIEAYLHSLLQVKAYFRMPKNDHL